MYDNSVTFTAPCPACGNDVEWTTSARGLGAPTFEIPCSICDEARP